MHVVLLLGSTMKCIATVYRVPWAQWKSVAAAAASAVTATVVGPFRGVSTNVPMPEAALMDPSIRTHDDLYQFSLRNPDKFWGVLAKSRLQWFRPFDSVSDCDLKSGKIKWFSGGKLNVSVNCIDRHVAKHPDKVALIWEKDEPGPVEKITYRQLHDMVCQVGNVLRAHGVQKGDRIAIYMAVSPMTAVAMLACARIGAPHSVVFAGFSAESLATRIRDAGVETVITMDQAMRGGRLLELKRIVDDAVKKCPNIKRVFVNRRTGNNVPCGRLDIDLDKEMARQSTTCEPEVMDSEDPLYMLYTSGSTGSPKGVVHTQAGYLLYSSITQKHVFEYGGDDIFGCVADVGWITGHSHVVYGPLCNGGTSLMFESTPIYPNPGRYWEVVEKLRLTHFYASPTAIRTLLRYGDDWVKKSDRSSLKILGSVGEPLNHDAWEWYHNVVGDGRCPVVDTWWQTETGGVSIAPRPSSPGALVKPAMAMRPMFGIEPVLLDEQGKEIKGNDVTGMLCIRQPWPSMFRTLYGNHERFFQSYFKPFPGYYFTGDGAYRDKDGYYRITGRLDDVINVSGHRLGTAEVEEILAEHHSVAEAAVVGFPHEIKGEGIYAFVVLKEGVQDPFEEVKNHIRILVRSKIASYAVPDFVLVCPAFPKTRSGKIMRRLLRLIAANRTDELGDVSTLADPTVLTALVDRHRAVNSK